jgi:hypothetical protein
LFFFAAALRKQVGQIKIVITAQMLLFFPILRALSPLTIPLLQKRGQSKGSLASGISGMIEISLSKSANVRCA